MRCAAKIARPLLAAAAVTLAVLTVLLLRDGGEMIAAELMSSAPGSASSQQSFLVNVTSGSGSGAYQPGDTVRVEPYRMPDMRVLERWEGDLPSGVAWRDPTAAHLTFTMPARDVAVSGTVRSGPLWALRETSADGGRVFHHPPAPFYQNIGGAVVLLHDAGQSADFWRHSTESRLFQRAAVEHGHGVLILESTDRVSGSWDVEETDLGANRDVHRLIASIGAAGLTGAPLVLVGVGQGGDFASLAAQALLPMSSVHVVGTVLVGSAGSDAPGSTAVPTMFVLGQREDHGLRAQVSLRHQALVAAGTPTELVELEPWPMFPRRFWRIDGLTAADSETVHRALVDAGVLDGAGWVTVDPSGLSDPGMPADLVRYWPYVREQLAAGWAGPGFTTHASEAMLEFAESTWGLPVPMPTAEPTRLPYAAHIEVVGGSKGKSEFNGGTDYYNDRDVVHVWADPDPEGTVFDRWTGTTEYLADPLARHTTATVSGSCCRITATYRAAPEWQPVERQGDGRQVFHHVPPDPVGVVFFFHGAGGSSSGWVSEWRVENRRMLRDAVARGYAVVVTESEDRDSGKWSPLDPPDNPDMQHVNWLLTALSASGELPGGLPTFGVGMSNGGGFVSRVADALGFHGAAVYEAACRPSLADTTEVPIIWLLAENDRRVSNQDAYDCHQRLAERGVTTELHVSAPSPVYPGRFRRIPLVTEAESLAVYDAVSAADILDRLDFQRLSPAESGWQEAVAEAGTVPLALAGGQLDVCYAEHRFFDDLNAATLSFFDRQRGAGPRPSATPLSGTPTPIRTAPTPTGTGPTPRPGTPTPTGTGPTPRPGTPTPTGTGPTPRPGTPTPTGTRQAPQHVVWLPLASAGQ